jgi:THO complex subunit 5
LHSHKYTKLQLIPAEEFLERFPQHADASEHDLMLLRIENEHQERKTQNNLLLAKLKQKQTLINEVKNSKDDLTKLDSMVEKFVEAAQPIREVLKLAAEE